MVCAQATAAEMAWAHLLLCPRPLRGPVSGQPDELALAMHVVAGAQRDLPVYRTRDVETTRRD